MLIETGFEQGSPEWHDFRIDSVGGTGLSKIITNSGGKPSESRDGYLLEKAGDIISRDPSPNFQTWEMKWGHKYEPVARETFELVKGTTVETCAMIFFDESRTWHISPDFFNSKERYGGEIKCYQLKAFQECIEGEKLPTKHILQCQAGLALTGWDYWWFMAFFPGLQPFFYKVERDEALIRTIKIEVRLFLNDLNKLIEKLRS